MILCPVESPARVTQHFHERPDYYRKYGMKSHGGVDLTGPRPGLLVPLYAPIEGKVVIAGTRTLSGSACEFLAPPTAMAYERK